MRIEIPDRLTPTKAINFANYIEQCVEVSIWTSCDSFCNLTISIRNNKQRYPNANHRLEHVEDTQGGQFAATFGLYQCIGHDVGWAKEERDIGYRYIPIKEISASDLHQQYTDTTLHSKQSP